MGLCRAGRLFTGRASIGCQHWDARDPIPKAEAVLLLLWYVLFADGCAEAEFRNAAEHSSSDIGTARVVAQILGKFLFAAVWSCEARLNRYPRHGENPNQTNALCSG